MLVVSKELYGITALNALSFTESWKIKNEQNGSKFGVNMKPQVRPQSPIGIIENNSQLAK